MTKRLYSGAVVVSLIGVLCAVWWMQPEGGPNANPLGIQPPPPPDDEDQFVGSARCSTCHPGVSAEYRAHPMSRSASLVTALPHSGRSAKFSSGPFSYEVESRRDGFLHQEILKRRDGEPIVKRVIDVHYAIGSGVRAKSYLTNYDGVLIQSPFTWYTKKNRWDLSPGYDPHKIDRFERRVGNACLFCHVGRTATIRRDWENRFDAKEPFRESSIGCERCHGPGRRHVELYESGTNRSDDRLIVNPSKLEPPLRDAICYQCHLSAKRVLRYGRRDYDFRPGNPLHSVWTIFVEETKQNGMEKELAVSHVQQMHASQCFNGGGSKMSCLSCHDAHSVPSQKTKAAFYRKRCQICHTEDRHCKVPLVDRESGPTKNSCIDCHMPRRETADVVHLTQSDHRIPRFAERSARPGKKHVDTGNLRLFDANKTDLPQWEISRGHGLALYQKFLGSPNQEVLKKAKTLLLESLEKAPRDVAVRRALGVLYYFHQDNKKARMHLEEAVRHAPSDDDSLALLGVICFRTGDYQPGLKYFERALKLNPCQTETYGRLAEIQAAFGDRSAAIVSLEKGLELNPTHFELRSALVRNLMEQGEIAKAQRQRELQDQIRRRLNDIE